MKVSKLTNLITVMAALSFIGAGCKHKPVGVTNIPGRTGQGVGDLGSTPPIDGGGSGMGIGQVPTGVPANPAGSHSGWNRDQTTLSINTVQFDYDSSVVKSSEKAKVSAVAEYLKSNSSAAVEVDGHCDERGTDEYNRALGERRALAIREELVLLGIEPGRVDTVSFGRERPIDTGHSDAAHARNRRGEFILLTPP